MANIAADRVQLSKQMLLPTCHNSPRRKIKRDTQTKRSYLLIFSLSVYVFVGVSVCIFPNCVGSMLKVTGRALVEFLKKDSIVF